MTEELSLLRIDGVLKRVPISEPTLYRMMKAGTFPRPCKVDTLSMWVNTEITAWITAQMEKR